MAVSKGLSLPGAREGRRKRRYLSPMRRGGPGASADGVTIIRATSDSTTAILNVARIRIVFLDSSVVEPPVPPNRLPGCPTAHGGTATGPRVDVARPGPASRDLRYRHGSQVNVAELTKKKLF